MEQENFQKFLPGFHSLQTNSFPCRKSPRQAARSLPKPLDSAYRLAYYKQGAAAVAGFKNQIDSGRQGYLRDTDCCRAAVETLSDGQQGMSNPRHSLIQYHRPEMLKLERWTLFLHGGRLCRRYKHPPPAAGSFLARRRFFCAVLRPAIIQSSHATRIGRGGFAYAEGVFVPGR